MSSDIELNSQPSTDSQNGVFYGWWIVAGALIAQMVAVSIMSSSSGIFLPSMTEELGWTQTEFTLGVTIGSVSTALAGGIIGFLLDRWGPRGLMILGTTIVGISLMYVSRIETLFEWFVIRGVVTSLGLALAGNLVLNAVVAKWFVTNRAWAISIASTGVSAAQFTGILLVGLISAIGWRDAWVVLGFVTWVVLYPVALMMRRQPEDMGLLPDGAREEDAADEQRVARARADLENSFTAGEAVRTISLWTLQIGFSFCLMGLIAGLFFLIPFMTLHGFTFEQAGTAMLFQGLAALGSKFVWPTLVTRIGGRLCTLVAFSIAGVGMMLMVLVGPTGQYEAFVMVTMFWGFGIGAQIPLQESLMASFFGRAHLGAIRGVSTPVSQAFGISAPVAVALYFDRVGDYNGVYLALAAGFILGALLVAVTKKPQKREKGRVVNSSVSGVSEELPVSIEDSGNKGWPAINVNLAIRNQSLEVDKPILEERGSLESPVEAPAESDKKENQTIPNYMGDDVDNESNQRELSSDYGLLNAGTSSGKRKKRDNPHLTQDDASNSMHPKSQTNDSRDYRSIQTRLVGDVQNLHMSSSAGAERIIRDILPAAAVGVAASALVLALYRMRNSK